MIPVSREHYAGCWASPLPWEVSEVTEAESSAGNDRVDGRNGRGRCARPAAGRRRCTEQSANDAGGHLDAMGHEVPTGVRSARALVCSTASAGEGPWADPGSRFTARLKRKP